MRSWSVASALNNAVTVTASLRLMASTYRLSRSATSAARLWPRLVRHWTTLAGARRRYRALRGHLPRKRQAAGRPAQRALRLTTERSEAQRLQNPQGFRPWTLSVRFRLSLAGPLIEQVFEEAPPPWRWANAGATAPSLATARSLAGRELALRLDEALEFAAVEEDASALAAALYGDAAALEAAHRRLALGAHQFHSLDYISAWLYDEMAG